MIQRTQSQRGRSMPGSHRTDTQTLHLKGQSPSHSSNYWLYCQMPSISRRQLGNSDSSGSSPHEGRAVKKQTEKQRVSLQTPGFPRLPDVDSEQHPEFCWGNTVIGQLATAQRRLQMWIGKLLQWADCSSRGRVATFVMQKLGLSLLLWICVGPSV